MTATSSMASLMPENDQGSTRGVEPRALPSLVGRIEAVRRRMAEDKARAEELHALTLEPLNAGLDGYGKDSSAAAAIGTDFRKVGDMRKGERPMALWQLVMLCADSPDFFIGFCSLFCRLHGLEIRPSTKLTADQVKDFALRLMMENPALLRLLRDEGSVSFGVEPAEIMHALGRGK